MVGEGDSTAGGQISMVILRARGTFECSRAGICLVVAKCVEIAACHPEPPHTGRAVDSPGVVEDATALSIGLAARHAYTSPL